jgi:hypothetical protein
MEIFAFRIYKEKNSDVIIPYDEYSQLPTETQEAL